MKRFITTEGMRLLYSDIGLVQDYWQDAVDFVLNEAIYQDDFCTGDNLKPSPTAPESMAVSVEPLRCYIDNTIGYLLETEIVEIDASDPTDRVDIISATVSDVYTDEEERIFVEDDDGTLVFTQADVNTMMYKKVILNYHKGTTEVPSGEMGIARVNVRGLSTSILVTDIEDIRPERDYSDLAAHMASVRATHADGSIDNQHIADDAAIETTKIDGNELPTLDAEIQHGFPKPFSLTPTYNVNGQITEMTYVSGAHNRTYTITLTDEVPTKITIAYPSATYAIDITYTDDNPSLIEGDWVV